MDRCNSHWIWQGILMRFRDYLANEEIKAKKTAKTKKVYGDQYYRQNKSKVKKKKKDLERSATGKVRNRMEPIMKKQRKTPTGRHRVEYN